MTTTNDGGPDTTNAGPELPELPTPDGEARTAFGVRSVYLRQTMVTYAHRYAEHVAGPLREQLGQCFRLSGADPDGNENWRIAPRAVDAVRQLREDYDSACDEAERLRERVAELDAQNKLLSDDLDANEAERDRIRAENEALASCLRECSDDLESEVEARRGGDVPRRIERDLEPVRKAREILAARAARENA